MSEPTRKQCGAQGVFRRILVGIDDSEPAGWAMQMAARIARNNGAEVAIVHVIPSEIAVTPEFAILRPNLIEDRRKGGQELLERAATMIDLSIRPELILKEGEPSQQVIATAHEWHPDVIIVGTHGRGAVAHMLLGSTAESIVRHAHAPVLTVGCDPSVQPKDQPAKADTTSKTKCSGKCEASRKLAGAGAI